MRELASVIKETARLDVNVRGVHLVTIDSKCVHIFKRRYGQTELMFEHYKGTFHRSQPLFVSFLMLPKYFMQN